MNKAFTIYLAALFALLFSINTSYSAVQTATEPLPDVTLTTPENPAHRKYLGLDQAPGSPFKINQIDADILLIELFSMYCPYCQKAAPVVNELYVLMEKKSRPDMKLVIIGIGANNTDLEVETFQQGFDIPFPMFSDPDMSIYKTLTGAGTPTFIGCKKDEKGSDLIFFRKSGGFRNTQLFFNNLLKQSGAGATP